MFEVLHQIRHSIIEPIGVGEGMNSMVYRAYDPYLQREIAVKEINKAKFANDFDAYCQEARAMSNVIHPNIVKVEYVCETADHVVIALPHCAEGSLKKRITSGPLDLGQFLRIALGILSGVTQIHSKGLLHLDLKPTNVLFDKVGNPLITDFGQARRRNPDGTVRFPTMYGRFMPPEVWDNHTATAQSDIYQLGLLFYAAVNGDPIYQAQKAVIRSTAELHDRVVRGKFPDRQFFLPHVPKRIRTIIRKALKIDPAERYHSAVEFASALGRVSLPLDWATNIFNGGACTWHACRPDKPDLEVQLSQDSTSAWTTRVWTVRGQERRAKGLSEYWQDGLTYRDACDHLTEVFLNLAR